MLIQAGTQNWKQVHGLWANKAQKSTLDKGNMRKSRLSTLLEFSDNLILNLVTLYKSGSYLNCKGHGITLFKVRRGVP